MNRQYFFNKPETLASYLLHRRPDASPLRMHKSMYFLYSYYGAFYGRLSGGHSESDKEYPRELFPATFMAWRYGPVLDELFPGEKLRQIIPHNLEEGKYDSAVLEFLDELIEQINRTSDFSLVSRAHLDSVWAEVYDKEKKSEELRMENSDILDYYFQKFMNGDV